MEGAMALALFHGDTNYIALAADAAVRIVAPESKRPVA
jgi:hypothetical protein